MSLYDDDSRLARLAAALTGDGPATTVHGVRGGFGALLLAQLARAVARPLIVVVPDVDRATVLEDGLNLFLGGSTREGWAPAQAFLPLDHLPFQGMSPSRIQVMERVTTLFRMVHRLDLEVVIIPAAALVDRVIPREALSRHIFEVCVGDEIDRDALTGFLSIAGYHRVSAVEDPGTYAVRGGIVDVYPPLYDAPVRIELWGDDVEVIRCFDPVTQRTTGAIPHVILSPARDILFTHSAVKDGVRAIRALADERNVPSSRVRAFVEDIEAGHLAIGAEELLPLFHESVETLFDVVPTDAVWVVEDDSRVLQEIGDRWQDLSDKAAARDATGRLLSLECADLFVPAAEVAEAVSGRARVHMASIEGPDVGAGEVIRFDIEGNQGVRQAIEAALRDGEELVLGPLASFVHAARRDGMTVVACAHNEAGMERLSGLIRHYGVSVRRHDANFSIDELEQLRDAREDLHLYLGTPGQGFRAPSLGLVLLDESEILGKPPRQRRRRRRVPPEQALQSWRDLHSGDLVVHLQHGIGRYHGLVKNQVAGSEADFLLLEYAGNNKLYVPVERLHLVSKLQSDEAGSGRLDKLGGTRWGRTKKRVKKAVRDIADKLIKLYAAREAADGFAFSPPDGYFRQFEAAFPFDETPDQARAIDETLADMRRTRPMDRIICGDVGFGKTEVALRAAFTAVLDGKQVGVLVPTQVLAEQHRTTFARRLEGFPVVVKALSRMRSAAEQKDILRELAEGRVDIVIGTHRLLSKDVAFRDLGLLVIDEEQRFGVSHKERLKELRASVDVLTLTATPIPRTLHMGMVGLRDISLIQTPPVDRLAIRTFVSQPSDAVITGAIRRELARGGQVFFVHNRVVDIDRYAELIGQLVPEARILVGHGQMDRGALEKVMLRFIDGEANVLVCTTIIESGLDIPRANTMLVNRADRFGLAQLYQLRGRIGRSSDRAFCYLLVPAPTNLTGEAKERIQAIQRFSELGSGFAIANYDLDVRGAGDLLGADQSGNIDAVGYDAYMELLREAIEVQQAEKAGEVAPLRFEPEIKVKLTARIPEQWLGDTTLRLRLYRDLAGAPTVEELHNVVAAAVDRYGAAPPEVGHLVAVMGLKLLAQRLGITAVSCGPTQLHLAFHPRSPVEPAALAALVSRGEARWRLTPDPALVRPLTRAERGDPLTAGRESLRQIANFVSAFRRASADSEARP